MGSGRDVYRARSMRGAYPFPGDLRAKFAWKEANRLSRGELIDNTAVTCSSLDRRPLPPRPPSRAPFLVLSPAPSRRALQPREIHFIGPDRRAVSRSSIPEIRDLAGTARSDVYRMCVILFAHAPRFRREATPLPPLKLLFENEVETERPSARSRCQCFFSRRIAAEI